MNSVTDEQYVTAVRAMRFATAWVNTANAFNTDSDSLGYRKMTVEIFEDEGVLLSATDGRLLVNSWVTDDFYCENDDHSAAPEPDVAPTEKFTVFDADLRVTGFMSRLVKQTKAELKPDGPSPLALRIFAVSMATPEIPTLFDGFGAEPDEGVGLSFSVGIERVSAKVVTPDTVDWRTLTGRSEPLVVEKFVVASDVLHRLGRFLSMPAADHVSTGDVSFAVESSTRASFDADVIPTLTGWLYLTS